MRDVTTIGRPAILAPGDPGWDGARRVWNLAVDQHPAAVVVPRTTHDVAAAVTFARERGLRVAAQGTGRHAAPLGSLADTLLIRTHAMREVSVDPVAMTAWAGAGVLWQEATMAAAGHGLAGLSSSSPDAGVAGHALGGGLSWLSRSYGLSANNVEAFEVVTADGELIRVDAFSQPGLFWALRGGGGSFGVVTGLELRLFPITDAYAGQLWWPADAGRHVLHAWRELTASELPEEFTTAVRYRSFPAAAGTPHLLRGRSFCVVTAIHLGSEDEADELLAPLRALGPFVDTLHMMPVAELGQLHADAGYPAPFMSDGVLLDGLPAEAVDEIVRLAGPDAGPPLLSVELRHLGGEVALARPSNGALPALPASHMLAATGLVPTRPAADAVSARIDAMKLAMSPWTARQMYLNLAGTSQDPASFWSPQAYSRLRRVKVAVDPWNVIRANYPIPPADQQAE